MYVFDLIMTSFFLSKLCTVRSRLVDKAMDLDRLYLPTTVSNICLLRYP